jgi:Holliday junction resolvasome RuvABC endonuclease subunit
MTPNVIGLDLSLTATGVAADDGNRTIKVRSTGMARLVELRDRVQGECHRHPTLESQIWCAGGRCDNRPDLVVIEGYSMGTARQSSHAHGLGELGGVVRLWMWEAGVPYVDIPPACLKKYATGAGNAKKEAVLIAAVKRGAEVRDNNEADAWWLRAMGMDALGCPVVSVPALHRKALATVAWPLAPTAHLG